MKHNGQLQKNSESGYNRSVIASKTKQSQYLETRSPRRTLLAMTNITMNINVTHIAKLANLPLKDEEKVKFEKQLAEVLSYVEQLQTVDTKNVVPTSQVTGLENVLREDVAGASLSQKDALSQTASSQNGLFKVSGIFEEE